MGGGRPAVIRRDRPPALLLCGMAAEPVPRNEGMIPQQIVGRAAAGLITLADQADVIHVVKVQNSID